MAIEMTEVTIFFLLCLIEATVVMQLVTATTLGDFVVSCKEPSNTIKGKPLNPCDDGIY